MSNGVNRPTNNIQDSAMNSFRSKPQSQTRNKAPKHASQIPHSNAPIASPIAPFREHDLYMPIANVVRIMRQGLPPHAKVADEAKEIVQECVSEFISFVTSEANETCKLEHRKTITAEDIIEAMCRLGFNEYVQTLMIYLHKLRESEMHPSIPRCGAGNMCTEASAVTPTTNVPPLDAVHPQFPMFRAAVSHSGSFGDGLGTSTSPITKGRRVDPVTICDGSGPSLALEIGSGPSGNERGGPYRSSQAELESYDIYGHHK